jgi:hypothetical protein
MESRSGFDSGVPWFPGVPVSSLAGKQLTELCTVLHRKKAVLRHARNGFMNDLMARMSLYERL